MKKKVQDSLKLIEKALDEHDKPFIASSFGKDSLVVMHLAHRVDDSVPVVFANTSVNHPSVYEVVEYYREKINLIETDPECSFWDIVDKYGWPIGARSTGSNKSVSECCKQLKKKPMAEATEGFDLEFNGMNAYESWTRYCRIKADGDYKFVKSRGKNGRQVALPIAWWRVEDVWRYINNYDIKYPEVYDQEVKGFTKLGTKEKTKGVKMDRNCIRVGCWTCPLPIKYSPGVMKQLREYYPKKWQALMKSGLADEIAKLKLEGQGKLDFDGAGNYLDNETRDHWLDMRPCFFDQI